MIRRFLAPLLNLWLLGIGCGREQRGTPIPPCPGPFHRVRLLIPLKSLYASSNITASEMTEQQRARSSPSETAILGGGCFWCTETIFSKLKGVESVESGYSGGTMPNPTYGQVCSGDTQHAEAVKITYNPNVITYKQLLEIFFTVHDPTTLNRQGADVGTQYRSVIFYQNPGSEGDGRERHTRGRIREGVECTYRNRTRAVHCLLQGGGLSSRIL